MRNAALLPLVLLLAGCDSPKNRNTRLDFTLTPQDGGHTAVLACQDSSSGSCHFLFKDGTKVVSNVKVESGATLAVRDLPSGVRYCGSITATGLADCSLEQFPPKRVHTVIETKA